MPLPCSDAKSELECGLYSWKFHEIFAATVFRSFFSTASLSLILTLIMGSPSILICIFVLILAFYGVLFPTDQEAAFSNYRLWESIGFVVSFAYANFICTDVKIYILIGVLSIGIILYAIIELIRKREMSTNIQRVCKG